MPEDRKISLCIPTWNRYELLIDSFINVLHDERISEIIICDDASDIEIYNQVKSFCDGISKIKLFRNDINLDCYKNKRQSLSHASNDFCILLDSDNVIDVKYIDTIFCHKWYPNIIYTPSFAAPTFDFRDYEKLTIVKYNVAKWIDKPLFETMLNAANFFVNKEEYLNIWNDNFDPVTSDSIFFCLIWLAASNKIWVVPDLTYQHTIHEGSHYKNNVSRTPKGFHESILNKLREMA